jgi:hypothetical protein
MRSDPIDMGRSFYTVVALVILAGAAHADVVAEVGAGATVPVSSSEWRRTVELAPTFAARAGGGRDGFAVLAGVAYTPERVDDKNASFQPAFTDRSVQRIRLLANVQSVRKLARQHYGTIRVGGGADIVRASWSVVDALGAKVAQRHTNVGYGFEVAGAVWFATSTSAFGIEGAIATGWHGEDVTVGKDDPGYAQVDITVSLVARFGR